jgi:hypothetical protein
MGSSAVTLIWEDPGSLSTASRSSSRTGAGDHCTDDAYRSKGQRSQSVPSASLVRLDHYVHEALAFIDLRSDAFDERPVQGLEEALDRTSVTGVHLTPQRRRDTRHH